MSTRKQLAVFILGVLTSFQYAQALTYGSDTAVAVQPLTTIAAGDATNQIIGFSVFASGVTIPNATTVCRYNNYFPFYGPITMNGGLFNLNRNLVFGSNATLPTGGQFNGNSFSLSLPTIATSFQINGGTMGNITLVVNSSIQLNALLTFTNTCVIEGNGNVIDCSRGGLAVGSGGSLMIQNATLKGLSNNRFYCYDNSATITFEDVTCVLNSTLTFSRGRLEFIGNTVFTGTQNFVYQSTVPMTIHSNATWMLDSGMTFSYDTNSSSLLSFDDVTSVLKLYETTLYADTPGLKLTKGTLILDGACPLINDALSSANGIWIGDGISASNNLNLIVLAESGIMLTRGFFVNNNV